ncbi:hypothetical protein [Haloarcula nitratireducens]|nr:hypothetical protein [Halomicroarcula nitratireducens]
MRVFYPDFVAGDAAAEVLDTVEEEPATDGDAAGEQPRRRRQNCA